MPKSRKQQQQYLSANGLEQPRRPVVCAAKPTPKPRAKPKSRPKPKWNPETQQLDYPATLKQVKAVYYLALQCNVGYVKPKTKREAGERIEGLIKLRKAQKRKAKRGRKRAERLANESPEQKAKRAQKRIERDALAGLDEELDERLDRDAS